MKNSPWLSFLLISVLTLVLPLCGFAERHGDSPLHGEMEAINRAARQLGRQLDDPTQKTSSLELLASMQKHAEKAKAFTPPKADKLSGDEKTKLVATFQKDLDALLNEIATLKDAITNDKAEAAKASFQRIQQLKDSSHKELGVESGPPRRRGGPPQDSPSGPPSGQ
jgi:soluble cytochrome b562